MSARTINSFQNLFQGIPSSETNRGRGFFPKASQKLNFLLSFLQDSNKPGNNENFPEEKWWQCDVCDRYNLIGIWKCAYCGNLR